MTIKSLTKCCDEGENLLNISNSAKEEYLNFQLPPAIKPLNSETPAGHPINSDWLKKGQDTKERYEQADTEYKKHSLLHASL